MTQRSSNELTGAVIGAAMEVHRTLGPGLLASAYSQCLCRELSLKGIPFVRELECPVMYKGLHLGCGYRVDLLVDGRVVVEVKAVEALLPVHQAQLITYLRLGGWNVGLLINFHVCVLKQGIRRVVREFEEELCVSSAFLCDEIGARIAR